MKIDFIIDSLNGGGAERVMSTLVNGFSNSHQIRLITFNSGENYKIDKRVSKIKLHQGFSRNHTVRSIINLYKFYKNSYNRPDVAISFLPANNLIAIIVCKLLRIKIIVSEHTNHTVKVSKKTRLIQNFFYRFSDAITVLTSFDKPYFEKKGAKVCIMPNPINLPTKINPYYNRRKNILMVGALDRFENKGFYNLIRIIQPILKKNKDWTLSIAGSGGQGMEILKNLSKKLGLQNQIEFLGFRKDIDCLMQNSRIFVLPSKFEGLPMGLMEALSNGMACISYDCPSGPSDLIKNQLNGLLIKNQDEKAMKEALSNLIQNYELGEQLSQNAPISMRNYSIDMIIQKWLELIKTI